MKCCRQMPHFEVCMWLSFISQQCCAGRECLLAALLESLCSLGRTAQSHECHFNKWSQKMALASVNVHVFTTDLILHKLQYFNLLFSLEITVFATKQSHFGPVHQNQYHLPPFPPSHAKNNEIQSWAWHYYFESKEHQAPYMILVQHLWLYHWPLACATLQSTAATSVPGLSLLSSSFLQNSSYKQRETQPDELLNSRIGMHSGFWDLAQTQILVN